MMRAITTIGVAALLALGGCGNKQDNPAAAAGSSGAVAAGSGSETAAGSASAAPAGSGSATSAASSDSASGSAATADSAAVVEVPTEEDFEKDAIEKITDKNVEAQVQALEKELEVK